MKVNLICVFVDEIKRPQLSLLVLNTSTMLLELNYVV
jgi:hypothetical protein